MSERYPSVDRIPSVTCPVLQLHGANDTIVPLRIGKKLFAAAPTASATGIANRFVTLTEADHNDTLWVAEDEMHSALLRFFTELPELN